MNRSLRWAARTAHALAGHIGRLRATLDLLGERLRDAVARAVGQSVADAAHDAVHSLLAASPADPDPFAEPSYARASSSVWYDDGRRAARSWHDDPDDPYRSPSADDLEEDPPEDAPGPPERSGRWGLALAVGCQATAWWLRRQTGRLTALQAVSVGLASAVAAFFAGPMLMAGAGLAGSALTLAVLSDAVGSGAAALFGLRNALTGTRP